MRPLLILCLALCLTLLSPLARGALPEEEMGGHLLGEAGGQTIALPVLKTEITGRIDGDLATVTVRQIFANPSAVPMTARYLFPLNKDAAVHAMRMEIGEEVVTARIAKRAEARRAFKAAEAEGKTAALLEQHRPNMFTQEIANLMPGQPVVVTLTYSQAVPRRDGAYELRVPLVVGPRYMPAGETRTAEAPPHIDDDRPAVEASGTWRFDAPPAYPPVHGLTIPPVVDADRVSIDLSLAAGMAIQAVESPTHGLHVTGEETARQIGLSTGRTVDNRDFVLRYSLAAAAPQAGVLTHSDAEGGTVALLLEPPKVAQEGQITPREMVFVLDTSGSMSGAPMEATKTFMRHALSTLKPADSFRIIRFSNQASAFGAQALPATRQNLAAGTRYVDGLSASGGTEILSGLEAAYTAHKAPGVLRIVVFLSDGYVGNEMEILRLVSTETGQGRLYAFGVGTSVNRYLIEEMARTGRGLSRIVDPTAEGQEAAIAFASRLDAPVLTDLEIDWGDLPVQDVTPAFLPDLFAGDSIRVLGRFVGTAPANITIKGEANGRPVSLPLTVDPTQPDAAGGSAIPLIWARSRIADDMREMTVPEPFRRSGLSDPALQARVTDLGLSHALVTQWTSFVAISEKIANPRPQDTVAADVPLPMVEGVTEHAYPASTSTQRAQATGAPMVAFSGGATPEPAQILGLLLLLTIFAAAALLRTRRAV